MRTSQPAQREAAATETHHLSQHAPSVMVADADASAYVRMRSELAQIPARTAVDTRAAPTTAGKVEVTACRFWTTGHRGVRKQ